VDYPNIDMDLLKHNYYSELSKYHPDKVAHLGDDLKNLADKKTKEIILNYNTLINWLKETV
jgi:DnaJ-domain-containing protein 1